jgi:hypothetical protein
MLAKLILAILALCLGKKSDIDPSLVDRDFWNMVLTNIVNLGENKRLLQSLN